MSLTFTCVQGASLWWIGNPFPQATEEVEWRLLTVTPVHYQRRNDLKSANFFLSVKANWGTSENNRRAKFYELTAAGRKRLREETESWNRLANAIGSVLAPQPEEVLNSSTLFVFAWLPGFNPRD